MKYYVYAYNYLTLYKALTYAENEWGFRNTSIIYTTFAEDAPRGLLDGRCNYHIITKEECIRSNTGLCLNYINRLKIDKVLSSKIVSIIKSEGQNDEICYVVFRDNWDRDVLTINLVKRTFRNCKIILIEEGLGLYATNVKTKQNVLYMCKKLVHLVMGVPTYSLEGFTHGLNPGVDEIICKYPELLYKKVKNPRITIKKEIELYNKSYCQNFVNNILKMGIPETTYRFVFLTQPLFPNNDNKSNEQYDEFLRQIFSFTKQYGPVLIKPHPKDKWDYHPYLTDKIDLCDPHLTKCPFECLMGYYGNPQTITLYSSAGCSIDTGKPNIFLYDMFPDLIRKDIFDEDFINNNNIQRCSNMQEFKAALIKEQ